MTDELYYAAGHFSNNAAAGRVLHVTEDCPGLQKAPTAHSCPASHPPRGRLCRLCAPDRDLGEFLAADHVVTACPACDDREIHERSEEHFDADARWHCYECGHECRAPVRRPRKHGGGLGPVGQALAEADPDAIPDGGRGEECAYSACDNAGVVKRRYKPDDAVYWYCDGHDPLADTSSEDDIFAEVGE